MKRNYTETVQTYLPDGNKSTPWVFIADDGYITFLSHRNYWKREGTRWVYRDANQPSPAWNQALATLRRDYDAGHSIPIRALICDFDQEDPPIGKRDLDYDYSKSVNRFSHWAGAFIMCHITGISDEAFKLVSENYTINRHYA